MEGNRYLETCSEHQSALELWYLMMMINGCVLVRLVVVGFAIERSRVLTQFGPIAVR